MIHEVIVTTISKDNIVHIAPMGIKLINEQAIISPFRPSKTLDNLNFNKKATINFLDDVRVFAGIVTKYKKDWELAGNDNEDFVFNLEDEIQQICRTFTLNNPKQENNLIDALKINCRKMFKEKTGKKPYTNINLVRI